MNFIWFMNTKEYFLNSFFLTTQGRMITIIHLSQSDRNIMFKSYVSLFFVTYGLFSFLLPSKITKWILFVLLKLT